MRVRKCIFSYSNFPDNLLIFDSNPGLLVNMQANFNPIPAANESALEELEAIFAKELLKIKTLCSEKLGEDRRIASVVIPEQFKSDQDTRKAAMMAGEHALGLINPWLQTRPLISVARLHYKLTECHEKNTARSWKEVDHCAMLPCNDEPQKEFQFMLVEYEKDYLKAKIVEIDRAAEETLSEQLWMHLGKSSYSSSSVSKSYPVQR